jgi:hypothetical protein
MRSIAGKWFNANEQHILDWYHIARRFEAIGKGLIYLHIMISEEDSGRSTRLEHVRERLAESWSYLIANHTRLINYGREYRKGHRISPPRLKS